VPRARFGTKRFCHAGSGYDGKRRPVDGAYFPFRIRHVEKGNIFTVRITQIKNNPPVDDSVFLKTESANADR
jgi:hypothetical protein